MAELYDVERDFFDPDFFRQLCQLELLEDLNLGCILPHLFTAKLVTTAEFECLSNPLFTTRERILKLTRILSSKDELCVPKFIECLEKETTHTGHANLLEKLQGKLHNYSSVATSSLAGSDTEKDRAIVREQSRYCGLGTKRVKRQRSTDSVISKCIPPSKRSGHLQRYHKECIKYINLEALVPYLNIQGLLSCSDEDHLMNTQFMIHERISHLIHAVSTKQGGFDNFLTAVGREKSHSGHHSLYAILTRDQHEVTVDNNLSQLSETNEGHLVQPDSTTHRIDTPGVVKQLTPDALCRTQSAEMLSEDQTTLFTNEYEDYLRKYYTSKVFLTDPSKWTPTTSRAEKYINLALIEKGEVNKTEADEYTQATIHGDIDDIMKQKKHMELTEVALPNSKGGLIPKYILVEGAPGVGKTTFSWELSKNWGNGTVLQQFKLVVLLRLREKRVQQMTSLSDVFFYSNGEVQQHVTRQVERTHGKGVLLILEGFDELPLSKRNEEFILYRILQGEILPEASVLVTTRHSASDFLFQHFPEPDQHIEILGFTKENIASYYESAMKSRPKVCDAFKRYLMLYPHIHSAMYVPLHCAIVVEVYMNSFHSKTTGESRSAIPKTMTQLYYSLTKCLLLRYLKAHKKYYRRRYRIQSFKDLPEKVLKQLRVISKLAYDGLLQDKVIFTDSDVPHNFNTLELMQTIPELYVDEGTVVSYNFIHLTLQEFLAAYYVYCLESKEWVKEFQRFKNNEKMKIMLRFLAGLTGFNGVRRKIIREVAFLQNTKHYREITVDSLHWLFEAQFEETGFTASVLGSSIMKVDCTWTTVSQFDCFVLGYCIARSKCKWELDMCECDIGGDGLLVLADAIRTNRDADSALGYISVLRLRGNGITSNALCYLFQETPRTVFSKLRELELGNNKIDSTACNVIAERIPFMPKLDSVSLSGNREIGKGGGVKLLQAMSKLQSRKLLTLFNTNMGTEETSLVAELLEKPPGVEVVYLGGTEVTTEIAERILQSLLRDFTTARELYIGGAKFTPNTSQLLAEVLRRNKLLEVVDLRYCGIGSQGGKVILEALRENKTIRDIMISKGNFLDTIELEAINSMYPQEDMMMRELL